MCIRDSDISANLKNASLTDSDGDDFNTKKYSEDENTEEAYYWTCLLYTSRCV